MKISFLWRILDPNWVHLMIEKRASSEIGFQIFALFNWIKFQIACISLTDFFCYFSNKNFVKMMEIPPGNIDHFELKCRKLKRSKKIFFKWSNWSWCTKKIKMSHLIKKVADKCCERMNDFCEVWYIGSWFLQNFSRNLRLRFQKLTSVSISLWLSLGHFHQIIHFRYICFEAFEFAKVLSSLLLALKLKIKIEYFGRILNIVLM